jgi:glycosyltransferase involved in cell wall biosynthesis
MSRALRILQMHKDFQPLQGGGGVSRHIHGLARALNSLGCDVRIVAPDAEQIDSSYRTEKASASELWRHVAWSDVVHIHNARSGYAAIGAITSAFAQKPFFYTPHAFYGPHSVMNGLLKIAWDRSVEKFLVENAAGTILLTDAWVEFLRSRGIGAEKVRVVPNCVLGSDFANRSTQSYERLVGKPAILSVGRLDPVKRLSDVIKALGMSELSAGHLHIVGKGDDRSRLTAIAAECGVADRVTFYGFVDDTNVARMMDGSDVFVLASEQEGLPTVLLEALIKDLPVVCTRIPGNLAITNVADIDSSYEIGDVPELARLLAFWTSRSVPPGAAEAVRRAFTWEYRAPEILSLYRAAHEKSQKQSRKVA